MANLYYIDDGTYCGELFIQHATSNMTEDDYYYIAIAPVMGKNKSCTKFSSLRFKTIFEAQEHLEAIARQKKLLTMEVAINKGIVR